MCQMKTSLAELIEEILKHIACISGVARKKKENAQGSVYHNQTNRNGQLVLDLH